MNDKNHYFKCLCEKVTVEVFNFWIDDKKDLLTQIKNYDGAKLTLIRGHEIFLPPTIQFPTGIETYCKAQGLQYTLNGDVLHIIDKDFELGLYNYRGKRTTKSTRPKDGKMVLVENYINYFRLPTEIRSKLHNGKCTQKMLNDAFINLNCDHVKT